MTNRDGRMTERKLREYGGKFTLSEAEHIAHLKGDQMVLDLIAHLRELLSAPAAPRERETELSALKYTDTDGVEHSGILALAEQLSDICAELNLISNIQMDQSVADQVEVLGNLESSIRALGGK